MHYLVKYFKHKMIFYAISMLIADVAAHTSAWLLLCLLPFLFFLRYKGWAMGQCLILIGLALTFWGYSIWQLEKLHQPLELPAPFTFTSEVKINGHLLRGFLKAQDGRKVYATYELKSEQEKALFTSQSLAGQQFFIQGEMVEPTRPAHLYSFSMESYLMGKSALGILQINQMTNVKYKNTPLSMLAKQRYKIKRHIERTFPESLVAEAQALLIGLQENVDEDLTRAYQKLGITHLFAISGLHVALVSLLFFQMLLRLRVRRELATIILIVVLPMYALVAGGAPSVWRAVAVVELVMFARYFHIKLAADDALAISFVVYVVLQPSVIYQIGFQLSYLATISLIYSSVLLAKQKTWWQQSFYMTFVCQLLVYPLLLVHFYEISLSSFLANILFVPLFSFVILPINIVLLILSYLPGPFFDFVRMFYEPMRGLLTEAIMWLQALPYQMWVPGKPNELFVLCLYVSVFVALYCLDCGRRLSTVLAILVVPALLYQGTNYLHADSKITFIDVGQGDCILIELPYRRGLYLIDSGGLLRFEPQEQWKQRNTVYEVGTDVVVPFLKGNGISKLDKLIITHADADHVEAAEEVMREVRVKEVHITPNSLQKEVMNDFIVEAKRHNIRIYEKVQNDYWQQAGATFQYVWPKDTVYEGNNDSLVLLMQIDNFRALFTGDLEAEGEKALLKQLPHILQNLDLLKAGHHGSKTSSSEQFISHTMPKLTVFMAGQNNRYGHPHAEVVERLNLLGLTHLTTGLDGTITVAVREGHMYVKKMH